MTPDEAWTYHRSSVTAEKPDPAHGDDGTRGRRAEPRVEATYRVRFRSLDDLVVTYTTDISRGGLFIATDRFLPTGTVVKLNVELPDGKPPASVLARVAFVLGVEQARERHRNPGMGMEFLDAGAEVAQRIATQLLDGLDPSPEAAAAHSADVLVVDDSPLYRDQSAALLRRLGHRVKTAQNGLEALGTMMREPVDIVLSDVQMPVMDGWQFLRLVRARPTLARTPVIFLTTLTGEAERLKGYQLGVDDYLGKPIDEQQVAERVAQALERARRRPASSADRGALSGDLAMVSLTSLLAFVEAERRSGALLVLSDPRIATLHIVDGQVRRVDLSDNPKGLPPIERLYHVLDWKTGRFEFGPREVEVEDEIGMPTGFCLMEHARRTDEANR